LKKGILIAIILFSIIYKSQSQEVHDTISIFDDMYSMNGKALNQKHLSETLKTNPEAWIEMKKANSNSVGAAIFGYTGGFCIGYPIGQLLAGGEPAWGMAGAGVILALISIPFAYSAREHSANAIRIYNSGIGNTGQNRTSIDVGFVYNRLRIVYRF
jgi:hypothetical protein